MTSQTTVTDPPPVALARCTTLFFDLTEHLIQLPSLPRVAWTMTLPLPGPDPFHELPTSVRVTLSPSALT